MSRARFRGLVGAATAVGVVTITGSACSTSPVELLQVELLVSDTIVSTTEAAEVTVRTTNVGHENVEVDPDGCPQVFRVIDSRARVVGPEPVLCALSLVAPRTLAPTESMELTYTWAGHGTDRAELPPGVYRLQGWVGTSSGAVRYSGAVRVRVPEP